MASFSQYHPLRCRLFVCLFLAAAVLASAQRAWSWSGDR